MPRKSEPHELAGAKHLARQENNPFWDDLSLVHRDKYLRRVRDILRASGRGGKVVADYENMNGRRILTLDLGPARRRRTRNG